MKRKLFIATSSFNLKNFTPKKKGFESIKIVKNPLKRKLNYDEVVKFAKDSHYIIAGTEQYNKKNLNKLKKLKAIFRLGSGIDNINLDICKKLKVKVFKSNITPEVAVSELIISNIINMLRKTIDQHNNFKNNIWKKEMGFTLKDKKVGIIGYGKIGKYLAKVIKGFGVDVYVNDLKKINNKNYLSLEQIFKKCDIVSLNSSLNQKSLNLINKNKLNLLKKNSIIINYSRPEVMDYNYLFKILKKRKILGAIIDVFPKEPYSGNFQKLDNVILTPHIGSYAIEIRNYMERELIDKVIKYNEKI